MFLIEDTILYRSDIKDSPFEQFVSLDKPISVIQTRLEEAVSSIWHTGAIFTLDTLMTELKEIKNVLDKMVNILKVCGINDWANTLLRLSRYIDDVPDEVIYKILSLYGGMGSLNDLVLSKNRKILQTENDLFDELRN